MFIGSGDGVGAERTLLFLVLVNGMLREIHREIRGERRDESVRGGRSDTSSVIENLLWP